MVIDIRAEAGCRHSHALAAPVVRTVDTGDGDLNNLKNVSARRRGGRSVLPKTVTIGATRLQVKVLASVRDGDQEVYGVTNVQEGWIKISSTMNKTADQLAQTYFHEYCHALLEICGFAPQLKDRQEEALVRLLEYNLFHLIDRQKLLGT